MSQVRMKNSPPSTPHLFCQVPLQSAIPTQHSQGQRCADVRMCMCVCVMWGWGGRLEVEQEGTLLSSHQALTSLPLCSRHFSLAPLPPVTTLSPHLSSLFSQHAACSNLRTFALAAASAWSAPPPGQASLAAARSCVTWVSVTMWILTQHGGDAPVCVSNKLLVVLILLVRGPHLE